MCGDGVIVVLTFFCSGVFNLGCGQIWAVLGANCYLGRLSRFNPYTYPLWNF